MIAKDRQVLVELGPPKGEPDTTLAHGGAWQDALLSATETNGQKVVPLSPTGARGFFRLHQP
jgi:hypothetical protein